MLKRLLKPWLQDLSIRYKLQLAVLSTTSIAIILAMLALAFVQWRSTSDAIRFDLNALAQVMAANSTAAISFNDVRAAEENLSSLKVRQHMILVCLYRYADGQAVPFAEFRASRDAPDCRPELLQHTNNFRLFEGHAQIYFAGEKLGEILILESDAALWKVVSNNAAASFLILVSCLLVAFLLSNAVQQLVANPIIELSNLAQKISTSRDFSLRAQEMGRDEVGTLILAINTMLHEIETAERQLRELNHHLETQVSERTSANNKLLETLDQLHKTRDQLVQTEKMASLGGLVAGVAHEINTPVGIGVTAASTLFSRSQEIREEYKNEELTEDGLTAYLDLAEQSSNIILSNLERAASLIQSFKQVAVDQSSLEMRSFLVRDYLQEILISLRPRLRKTKIEIQVDCPDDLKLKSYPGLFSQIVTNLVMNSLLHAFDENSEGNIRIRCAPSDEGMLLEFTDNGKGIPKEIQEKVFDPFFTTRRGEGGSGLGLHIVYNLVTQQLGGKIQLISRPGIGTIFFINLKSKAHEQSPLSAKAS